MDWYYQEGGAQVGPLTDGEFEQSVKQGKVRAETLVWNESLKGWQPYQTLTGSRSAEALPQAMQRCANCMREFPQQDMIRYQNSWVCASCKPIFFQKLKEGGAVPGLVDFAGFWPRAGAKIIDQVIVSAVNMIFMFLFIFGSFMSTNSGGEPSPLQIAMILLGYALVFVFSLGYSVWFLARYGATPGKMALGLKVVTPEGGSITLGKAFARFFAELLSGMVCYIGYIMVAFDKEERKALHDILCNTRVIRK